MKSKAAIYSLIVLAGLILSTVLRALILDNGFISVSADEMTRTILARQWADNPEILGWTGNWMPLERYLNGCATLIFGDSLLAGRITAGLFASITLAYLAALTYRLFSNWVVVLVSTLTLATYPWFVWLGATPMLDIYFMAPFIGGVFWVCSYLRSRITWQLYAAAAHLAVSTAFHISAWIFVSCLCLVHAAELAKAIRSRDMRVLTHQFGFLITTFSYIGSYLALSWFATGHLIEGVANHTDYSKWFYGGYNVSIIEKLLYYPNIVLSNAHYGFLLLAAIGTFIVFRRLRINLLIGPIALLAASLAISSVFNLTSGPPSAAPGRYAFIYVVLLCPYFAYGLVQFTNRLHTFTKSRGYVGFIAASAIVGGIMTNSVSSTLSHYPRGVHSSSITAGKFLAAEINQTNSGCTSKILIERVYWEFLGVLASSNLAPCFQYDRDGDLTRRNEPSILDDQTDLITMLESGSIGYALVWRNRQENILTNTAEKRGGWIKSFGPWTLYKL